MAKIFISYSREDIDIVKKIEQSLIERGHVSWRDQESVYAGQNWPKTIGEAIADNDFLLLFWSKNAKDAHFIEFEWSTAIALRKQILPIFLDKTPLPPSLSAVNGIPLENIEDDFSKIVKALEPSAAEIDKKQVSNILEQFDNIKHKKPEQAIKAVKKMIEQKASNVQGSVYQAGRDVIIHHGEDQKKYAKHIVIALSIFSVLVIMITIISTNSKLWQELFKSNSVRFQGIVIDIDENGKPVGNAEIVVYDEAGDEVNIGSGKTDSNGDFGFDVKAKPEDAAYIVVTKDGHIGFKGPKILMNPDPIPFSSKRGGEK